MADTIVRRFLDTAKRHPLKTAVRFNRRMSGQSDTWLELNWNEYRRVVESLAAGLQAVGARKGDRIAILAHTRLEWAALDLAIMGLGAVTVPIYPGSTAEDIAFILDDSNVKIFFAESPHELSNGKGVDTRVLITASSTTPPQQMTLDKIQLQGETALKASPALYELAAAEVRPDDLATIIYTSGTTGRPRGVVHTHVQVMSEVAEAFPLLGVSSNDVSLTFLPFAHVLGRIEIWGHAMIGYTMGFAESIDRLKEGFAVVRPTIIVAVPRVFEKIYAGIQTQADISPLRRKAFDWALDVGEQVSLCKQNKKAIPLEIAVKYAIARKLIFDSISTRLGGRLRFAVCGGAPLNRSIAEFFHAAGILILEGYGLTETMAAVCVNTPFDYRFGTVGKPIGDVKVKIAPDGEVLIQSRKVMREYLGEKTGTAEAIQDGWLYTGDIGSLDERGHLIITDRKKDLLKTVGGKYVAPQRLEGLVKLSPFVSHVHIHGDNRKFVVAIVTLASETIESWAKDTGVAFKSVSDLSKNPKVKELVRRSIAAANSQLASFETIKNFAILDHDFSTESGELTPSLKVKRKVVDARYKSLIDSLY